jgi:hypothetical protein
MFIIVFRKWITAKIPLFLETPKPFTENVAEDASFFLYAGFFSLQLPYLYISNVISALLTAISASRPPFLSFVKDCVRTRF